MVRVDHTKAIVHYAIIMKIFPLIMMVPLFLVTSLWTRAGSAEWLSNAGIDLTVEMIYFTTLLTFTGVVFLIETAFALPEYGKSNAGLFGAVLLGGLAVGSFLFAGAIFTGAYADPTTDNSEVNIILSILMLISIAMFVVQAREEIFHFRRLSFHSKYAKTLG